MDFVKLEKGKLIDAQEGFVDSWNRMVDCWNNLTGAGKAEVRWPLDTVPTVDVDGLSEAEDEAEDEDEENLDDIAELVLPEFDPCRPSSSGREYIPGDDTNIVFSEVTAEGPDKGKVKVDVYYI